MNVAPTSCEQETQHLWWLIRQFAAASETGDTEAVAEWAEMLAYRARWSDRPTIRAVAAKALKSARRIEDREDAVASQALLATV